MRYLKVINTTNNRLSLGDRWVVEACSEGVVPASFSNHIFFKTGDLKIKTDETTTPIYVEAPPIPAPIPALAVSVEAPAIEMPATLDSDYEEPTSDYKTKKRKKYEQ